MQGAEQAGRRSRLVGPRRNRSSVELRSPACSRFVPSRAAYCLSTPGSAIPKLRSQVRRDRPRHVGGVGQERAEEPDGAQLDSKPEAVVLPATDVDEVVVGGIEVEVAAVSRLIPYSRASIALGVPSATRCRSCVACSAFSARGRPRYAPRLRASAMPSRWRSRISDRSNSANGKAMLAREYGISRETVYQYLRATT